jgi:hypothetical protein
MIPPRSPGRPRGARNLFNRAMINDLQSEWLEGGRAAIKIMRLEEPSMFVRACLSTLPKELLLETSTMKELHEDELDALIDMLRRQLLTASEEKPVMMIEATKAKEPADAQ